MGSNVTLKHVARRAGVSYQTVSKVLRGQLQVRPETRQRIEAAVSELGYRPNTAARSLRTQATYLIGYSWQPPIYDDPNPILEAFLQSIVHAAETHQYHIMLFPYALSRDVLLDSYRDLITMNRVDGFILSDIDFDDPRIHLLKEENFPFVAFGCSTSSSDCPYVDVDGHTGIRLAVEHLMEQGHQRIAILAWPEASRVGAARLDGYTDGMQNAGLPVDPDWVRRGVGTPVSAYEHTHALLDLVEDRRPTAIVTLADNMALGAIHAIQERGHRVGGEIGVTGFDDTPLSRHTRPAITTLRQPVEQIGAIAVNLLIKILAGDLDIEKQLLIPPELIVRESSLKILP